MTNIQLSKYIDINRLTTDLGLTSGDALKLKGRLSRKAAHVVNDYLLELGYADKKVDDGASAMVKLADRMFLESVSFRLGEKLTASQEKVFKKPGGVSRYKPILVDDDQFEPFDGPFYLVDHGDAQVYFRDQGYEPKTTTPVGDHSLEGIVEYGGVFGKEQRALVQEIANIPSNKQYLAQAQYSVYPVDEDGFVGEINYPLQEKAEGIPAARWKIWSKALAFKETAWYCCRTSDWWFCRSGNVLIAQKIVQSELS